MRSPIFQSLPPIMGETITAASLFEVQRLALSRWSGRRIAHGGTATQRRGYNITFSANNAPSILPARQRDPSSPRRAGPVSRRSANPARGRAQKS